MLLPLKPHNRLNESYSPLPLMKSFDDFKISAQNTALSLYEKIGFPDEYRAGKASFIVKDIAQKTGLETKNSLQVADIGCGCTDVAQEFINLCEAQKHNLHLIDHEEMLAFLPTKEFLYKHNGAFPKDMGEFLHLWKGKIDVVICYSVFQYPWAEGYGLEFLDNAVSLLAKGGCLLLGDLPNDSKRARFFSSEDGKLTHKHFTLSKGETNPDLMKIRPEHFSDEDLLDLLKKYRHHGFETYLVPQPVTLYMSNRREDILIYRP
jgi:hypothetical protein